MPSIAEAFAAILAAEREEHGSPDRPAWPSLFVAPAPPPPTIEVTEEMLEDIVRRVVTRLTDSVVRQTTTEIVSQVAERMVREEIERIKAALK